MFRTLSFERDYFLGRKQFLELLFCALYIRCGWLCSRRKFVTNNFFVAQYNSDQRILSNVFCQIFAVYKFNDATPGITFS